jgi:hypothetical protein
LLWAHASSGWAKLWALNAAGAKVCHLTYALGAGWEATSYHRNRDGTARMLWANASSGTAKLWTLNAAGVKVSHINYSLAPGWQATSYHRNSDGTARLLWGHVSSGWAKVWTLNAAGAKVSHLPYGLAPGWQATGYHRESDGTARLVWSNVSIGWAKVWTLNAAGAKVSHLTYGIGTSGWKATSYHGMTSSGIMSVMAPGASLVIKKAGTGQGTISADEQACGPACAELTLPYVEQTMKTLQVVPAADSSFVRWETADGALLEKIYYAQPGETVIAVFEKK